MSTDRRAPSSSDLSNSSALDEVTKRTRTPNSDDSESDTDHVPTPPPPPKRARRRRATAMSSGKKSKQYLSPIRSESKYYLAVHVKSIKKVNPSSIDVKPNPHPFHYEKEYLHRTTFQQIEEDLFNLLSDDDNFGKRFCEFDDTFETMGIKIWNGKHPSTKKKYTTIVKQLNARSSTFLKSDDIQSTRHWKDYAQNCKRRQDGNIYLDVGIVITTKKAAPRENVARLPPPLSPAGDDDADTSAEDEILDYVPPDVVQVVIRGPVTKDDNDQEKTMNTADLDVIEIDMKEYIIDMGSLDSDGDNGSGSGSGGGSGNRTSYKTHILTRFKNELCRHIFLGSKTKKEYQKKLSTQVSDLCIYQSIMYLQNMITISELMLSQSKMYTPEHTNRKAVKVINSSLLLTELFEKGKAVYKKHIAEDVLKKKAARKNPDACSRVYIAFGAVNADQATNSIVDFEDDDDEFDLDLLNSQPENFLSPMKYENKKSASMRSKQHPVVLREKLLELYSDATSIFYKGFTYQMMTSITQLFPFVRKKEEVEEWLHVKDLSDPENQDGFLKECSSVTKNDSSNVKYYEWKKGRYPPEEGKSVPPDQEYWVANTIEGGEFAKRFSSSEQSKGGNNNAILRMASAIEQRYADEKHSPFVVRVVNSESNTVSKDVKVGMGGATYDDCLWDVLKKAAGVHPNLYDDESRIFKVEMKDAMQFVNYDVDESKSMKIHDVYRSTRNSKGEVMIVESAKTETTIAIGSNLED